MPPEWDAFHEPDRALELPALRKAKDVIRKVRERKFIPEEFYGRGWAKEGGMAKAVSGT